MNMMRCTCIIAALAFAAALPSDQVSPDDDFAEARGVVETLLQDGKGADACLDLAEATRKEVRANVEDQQKLLNAMPRGKACDSEGSSLVNKANKRLTDATNSVNTANAAVQKAANANIDFGKFKFSQLNEKSCEAFYSQAVYKNAKQADKLAKAQKTKAGVEVKDSKRNLSDAKKTALSLVNKCKCKARTALIKARKTMNKNLKAHNIKAWTKARHMECVVKAIKMSDCKVSKIPEVKAVKLGNDFTHVCYNEWLAPSNIVSKSYGQSGKQFKLVQLPKQKRNWANQGQYQNDFYIKSCADVGAIPIGCGSNPNYKCTNPKNKCMPMPPNWGCNMASALAKNTKSKFKNYGQGLMGYYIDGRSAFPTWYTQGKWPVNGAEYSMVCGIYIGGHYEGSTWKANDKTN